MKAPKIIAAAALALAVTAGGAAIANAAVAAPRAAAPKAAAPKAAPAAAAAVETTHLVAWSVDNDGPFFQAVLTDAVGDYGQATFVFPNGSVDPDHTNDLRLELANGSFLLSVAPLSAELGAATGHWKYDATTCSVHVSASGAAPIVAGSGTGAYTGISGSFALTIAINEVDGRQPGCSGHVGDQILAQMITVTGTGTVRL